MPVKWNQRVIAGLERKFGTGMLKIATEVRNRAQDNAPVKTGSLKNSASITSSSDSISVGFGSSAIKYARIRHNINKKNPQTVKYLKRAADSVKREGVAKYFKGANL